MRAASTRRSTLLANSSEYRRAHWEAKYGSLARDRGFLERIAPINHIGRLVAPLIVVHGANDPRVLLSEAEQLVEAPRQYWVGSSDRSSMHRCLEDGDKAWSAFHCR